MFANISDKHFLTVSAAFASIKMAFDTYIFSDWQFAYFVICLLIVDTCLGTYKSWKKKTLESRAFARLFEKIALYGAILITANALINFPIKGAANGLFNWVDSVLYCSIIVREALSIFENVAEISPNLISKRVLARLKSFDESGEFKDLI